jgi:predicted flap endonuclease-1-like 5' DNA nuclease
VQKQLNELGIRHFQGLATLNAADIKILGDRLGVKGRIEQENWLGQAQILAKGGETYYSRRVDRGTPPAPAELTAAAPVAAALASPQSAAPADMGALRSVRSEALLGAEAVRTPRGWTEVDDLKRIRGIGVLIEKKLNSLGVTHYEQVANWTGADIERISNILDFKGRIERENWIEQARILATGGQTEFSRRNEA